MTDITAENNEIIKLVSQYIDLSVTPFNKPERTVVRVDKRDPMYGGNGIVYLLQMFDEGELTNNRIGAYMVFLNKGDQTGFHTHGTRNEEELYIVMHGEGEYLEMTKKDGIIRKKKTKKRNYNCDEWRRFSLLNKYYRFYFNCICYHYKQPKIKSTVFISLQLRK